MGHLHSSMRSPQEHRLALVVVWTKLDIISRTATDLMVPQQEAVEEWLAQRRQQLLRHLAPCRR
jgi:hypothetical protein